MNIQEHTTPEKLEKYSFLWSEIRLVVAALALIIGGVPPVLYFNPIPALYGLLSSLLTIAWIVSGASSIYLVYKWNKEGQKVFGGKTQLDTAAFFIMIISGINLGLTGLLGSNIGMSISSNRVIFILVAFLYLASAYHLHRRWKAYGQRLF